MDGFIPSENMRFRDHSLSFNISDKENEEIKSIKSYKYSIMSKTFDNKFNLKIEGGEFSDSEIICLLGENGTGKTTFIKMLAGSLEPDENCNKLNLKLKKNKEFFSTLQINVSLKLKFQNLKFLTSLKL